jgi:hypothetical protein
MQKRTKAFASLVVWCAATAGLSACGDDTIILLPDSSAPVDATTEVGPLDASGDATSHDAQEEEPCAPYDASGFTDAEIQGGAQIVASRKCEQCHGEELQGSSNPLPSTNAEGGFAYAPDLTPDPVNGLGCWTNAQIERAFLHGIDNEGQPLCNPMPHWGELDDGGIDEAGAEEVLAYLRTIPIVVNPNVPNTGNCPAPEEDAGEEAGNEAGGDATMDGGADAAADAGPDVLDATMDADGG